MANSGDRRILQLPLILSGNINNNIVLPLDDPSDNLTKKINLGQIKDFVNSGFTSTYAYTPSSSGDTNGVVGQVVFNNNYIYVKTNLGWGRYGLDYGF